MNSKNYRNPKAHYSTDSSEDSLINSSFESNHILLNQQSLIMTEQASSQDFLIRPNHDTDQQSRRSSIASNNSYFSVRHSLSLLPTFNGTNIPVHQFTSDCKGVLELVEPDERSFLFRAILQAKLTGEAALVRSIYTITNLDELCEALIKEFGSYKTFDHWELEINNLRQNRDESIEQYVSKVRKLNSEMIITISNYPDQAARAGLKVFATNKLIDHFLGGLHKHIGQHLLAQKFNTLEDAIESTVRFIKKSQYHTERFRANNKSNQSTHITCNYCKKIGHSESECRKKAFHTQNQNRNSNTNYQYSNHNRSEFNSVRNFDNNSGGRFNNTQTNRQQINNGQNYNNRFNSGNSSNNYNNNNGQFNNHLNYQGQAKSAQRQGQLSSRANPIHTIETESEHSQSEQLPEISSPSPSSNSETQQINSY